jgi:hypothetical protein
VPGLAGTAGRAEGMRTEWRAETGGGLEAGWLEGGMAAWASVMSAVGAGVIGVAGLPAAGSGFSFDDDEPQAATARRLGTESGNGARVGTPASVVKASSTRRRNSARSSRKRSDTIAPTSAEVACQPQVPSTSSMAARMSCAVSKRLSGSSCRARSQAATSARGAPGACWRSEGSAPLVMRRKIVSSCSCGHMRRRASISQRTTPAA